MKRIGEYRETCPKPIDLPSIYDELEPPLSEEDRRLLSKYLRNCYCLAATSPGFTDIISGKQVNGRKNLYTNGIDVWTADLAHYVESYGLNPGSSVLSRARFGVGLNMSEAEKIAAQEAYWNMPRWQTETHQ